MELEEMQAAWTEMSSELEKQKVITNELIMKMTQERYTNTWNHIRNFELLGTLICYGALIYLLINFGKLDTTPLLISGIIAAIIMAILPALSLKSIRGMKEVNVTTMTVKETMATFTKRKKQFVNFQKLNVGLSFIFMLVTVPLSGKLINGEDLFARLDSKLLIALPAMLILFAFLFWFVKRTYKRVILRSERLIDEAKNQS
jgi:hypothetical protein